MLTEDRTQKALVPKSLLLVLLGIGLVLTVTVVPGVFSVDENNYLVSALGMREGRLTVPGTENLTPSKELFSFDPEANRRAAESTPVVSLVPPLYAFFAAPLTYLGWGGLVLLNTLAFLVAALLVFLLAQRYAQHPVTPWLAFSLFVLGGYSLEYVQGVWPHMLAVALCMGAVYLSSRVRDTGSIWLAFAAGALIGTAAGVREQNIFFGACVGLGILLWAPKRWWTAASYGVGVALPMLVSATINDAKFGIWNPLPKANVYVAEVAGQTGHAAMSLMDALGVFWAKVVDYSTYPHVPDPVKALLFQHDPTSGAVLVQGVVKKAWVQSSPWIALALVLLAAVWVMRSLGTPALRREMKAISLVVFPTVLMFTVAGFGRVDGWAYNQRYFLELVPLVAVALALAIDQEDLDWRHLFWGFVAGVLVTLVALAFPGAGARHLAILYLPLALAAVLIAAWGARRMPWGPKVLSLVLGVCVGWSLFLHVGDDLRASRHRRQTNAVRLESLERMVPDHSALVAYWGYKDAAGPLRLWKDIVILDAWADQGADAPELVGELLRQGRRVYVLEDGFPRLLLQRIVDGHPARELTDRHVKLVEILTRP